MFRLLGPSGLHLADAAVDLGSTKQRLVLAVLLADAGRTVTVANLTERVWADGALLDARNAVYTYVSRLRRVLERVAVAGAGSALVVRRPGGYALEVDPDLVDVHRFRRLVAAGMRDTSGPAVRATLLREALDLWHGTPLIELRGEWAARTRSAWCQQHLEATVAWANAELRLGVGAPVVGPLVELVAQHPFDEPLLAALMRALHSTGRGGKALDLYAQVRRRLLGELGTEPGGELQAVHLSILRAGPVTTSAAGSDHPTAAGTRPAQIPPAVAAFTGRSDSLGQLNAVALAARDAAACTVVAVVGTAGVGKTALAVQWAHRAAGRFPDGQLHLNLQGYASSRPTRPIDALGELLRSLGVPSTKVPVDLAEATALYRSVLAGRRVLVLLDNARSADQVRPLLPGSAGCLVLVTSRDRLGGLVARDGAHHLALDVLTSGEAQVLLERLLGRDRVRAEADAAAQLAEACAYLPLAMRVAAAKLICRPNLGIADQVAQLRDGNRLAVLSPHGDREAAVSGAFDLSYRSVSVEARRLFRLLGRAPGTDFAAAVAASLSAATPAEVAPLLDELAAAHLINEHVPDRFTFHELLRQYANDRAESVQRRRRRRRALRVRGRQTVDPTQVHAGR
ncbi:BTAD domain-containing putative transcriptional regulator [Micromonospora sp. WMMA1998]|uniref:AfsR/SARP family transcriptional regulator n=1 Tax=Micromonospora sp. WMMA1998 TaxID=3015167 RepID=UPI00248C6177|nr:BTAD domain-containing putative transcriptional regulator [Micromonospora sp. WMMA1998]WBC14925.1 BTAD domain-containing putative transcriptional regulator [Micromonospora sp. WMMA1998]